MRIGGERRTVKEGLAVDGAPLLELLLHLIRNHLLTEAHLTLMRRTVVIVVHRVAIHHIGHASLLNFVIEATVPLALKSSFSIVVFCPWLCPLVHLFHLFVRDLAASVGSIFSLIKLELILRWATLRQSRCLS